MFQRLFNTLVITMLMAGGVAVSAYADCTGPAGKPAEIIYNVDYKVMQYCNGTVWVGMGSGDSYFWQEAGADKIRYNGAVIVGNSPADCDDSVKGALRYDPAAKRFEGCNGADGWQPLVQTSQQLGSVLYSSVYIETDYNAYNTYVSAAQEVRANLNAGEGTPVAQEAITWFQNTCLFAGGALNGQNNSSSCGTEYCIAKTGKQPVLVQSLWSCPEGGPVSCNNGHFVIQWSCLTPG